MIESSLTNPLTFLSFSQHLESPHTDYSTDSCPETPILTDSDDKTPKTTGSNEGDDFKKFPVAYKCGLGQEGSTAGEVNLQIQRTEDATLVKKISSFSLDDESFAIYRVVEKWLFPGYIETHLSHIQRNALDGRTKLIQGLLGQRNKLETREGNHIDSVFINRRGKTKEGHILVICCEGSSGFYETGIMKTPFSGGYSILGWNYPGYMNSTGKPTPDEIVSAADTVMKFAIEKLNFKIENILIFGHSLGGYPASYLAKKCPKIAGLILDTTFDDIVPLAIFKLPCYSHELVENIVKCYFNINIAENISSYNGPVLLIRRLKDELINADPKKKLSGNRSNYLLISLLEKRFPNLFASLQHQPKDPVLESTLLDYLSGGSDHQKRVLMKNGVNESICHDRLVSYIHTKKPSCYPVEIGEEKDNLHEKIKAKLLLYLVS